MKIFIVLCCDRHTDPDPRVFISSEEAFREAHEFADEYDFDKEDEDRKPIHHDPKDSDGVLFTQSLSEEGDYVTIYQRELGT